MYSASSDLSHPDLSTKPDLSTLFFGNENVTNRRMHCISFYAKYFILRIISHIFRKKLFSVAYFSTVKLSNANPQIQLLVQKKTTKVYVHILEVTHNSMNDVYGKQFYIIVKLFCIKL